MSDKEEDNNKEYSRGYDDARSGDWSNDMWQFGPDRDQYDKGYSDGKSDRSDHGRRDKGSTGSGETKDSGGCFLTTACVEHFGLADDCDELTVLRSFRDRYMANLPDGKKLISEYYREAPLVVASIDSSPEAADEYDRIFNGLVTPAVGLIKGGNNREAFYLYVSTFKQLREKYVA